MGPKSTFVEQINSIGDESMTWLGFMLFLAFTAIYGAILSNHLALDRVLLKLLAGYKDR
jgi:hypothetical protein